MAGQFQNLKPWQKGCPSPNPGGRPRNKPFTEAIKKAATEEELASIVQAVIAKAKDGDIKAAEFLADRLDGKMPLPIKESEEGTGIGPVFLSASAGSPTSKTLTELPDADVGTDDR
jgi:hypothetical protein